MQLSLAKGGHRCCACTNLPACPPASWPARTHERQPSPLSSSPATLCCEQRRKSTEPLYNQLPGTQLYIGGWPEQAAWLPDVTPSVLDVTCELPRTFFGSPYLCLPTWDTQGARWWMWRPSCPNFLAVDALHAPRRLMVAPPTTTCAMPCLCLQRPTPCRFSRVWTGRSSRWQLDGLCTSTAHTGMGAARPSWLPCSSQAVRPAALKRLWR